MSTTTLNLSKQLDLRKEKVLNLKKSIGLDNQKAQVVLVLDYSYSMDHLYQTGQVQDLVERLLPIGMAFDDNQEVDFYLFHNGKIKLPENLTVANIPGYINRKVLPKHTMGGTSYAPVIDQVMKDFAPYTEVPETYTETVTKGGFLGIGGKKETVTKTRMVKKFGLPADLPTYVIFITDGDNGDHAEAERAVREASAAPIFFQFVGIGRESFPFLSKMDTMSGRVIDNANFFSVSNLGQKSDDELYKLLLTEFPSYVKEARTKGLIK